MLGLGGGSGDIVRFGGLGGLGLGWLDTAGYRILWIQWIQDTAGYAAFSCVRVQLRSAWIQVCVQLRSGTCVQLRSAFGCVLRSAAFCVLRSAAFCVRLRSAFSCVQESAFSCVLRSAAFAFSCVQLYSGMLLFAQHSIWEGRGWLFDLLS